VALLAMAAMIVLAWSAPASASTRGYNGPAGPGAHAGVEFGAHFRNGRARNVYRFEFHNIPAVCQGSGTTAATDELGVTMRVNRHRRFGRTRTLNGGRLTVKVTGRFAKDFSKAGGTLRVHGTVPGCPNADTGVVHWHAPRVS
jgi:hypothetical protein